MENETANQLGVRKDVNDLEISDVGEENLSALFRLLNKYAYCFADISVG